MRQIDLVRENCSNFDQAVARAVEKAAPTDSELESVVADNTASDDLEEAAEDPEHRGSAHRG